MKTIEVVCRECDGDGHVENAPCEACGGYIDWDDREAGSPGVVRGSGVVEIELEGEQICELVVTSSVTGAK